MNAPSSGDSLCASVVRMADIGGGDDFVAVLLRRHDAGGGGDDMPYVGGLLGRGVFVTAAGTAKFSWSSMSLAV